MVVTLALFVNGTFNILLGLRLIHGTVLSPYMPGRVGEHCEGQAKGVQFWGFESALNVCDTATIVGSGIVVAIVLPKGFGEVSGSIPIIHLRRPPACH